MTRKERIFWFINRQADDVSYDEVMEHLDLMKAIEEGEEDIRQGRVIDHDELFDSLLKEDAKNQNRMDRAGQKRSGGDPAVHRKSGKPKNGKRVHPAASKRRQKA